MNWKSSLTGVVIVAAAGLVAGFAVGGKTTAKSGTHTLTVAQTVTETVTSSASGTQTTASAAKPAGSPGSSSNGGGSNQQYYADYLSSQDSGQLNNNATNVQLDENPSSLQLNGQTYAHAVAFDLTNDSSHLTESFQMPVPGFKRLSASVAGLATNNSAKASYKLTIFKNNDNPGAPVLFSATFVGPSGTHPISFDTQGATDVVVDWTQAPSGEPDPNDEFILADPIVTR